MRRIISVDYSWIPAIRTIPWQDRQLRTIDDGEEVPIASRDHGSLQTLQVLIHPCFFRYVTTFGIFGHFHDQRWHVAPKLVRICDRHGIHEVAVTSAQDIADLKLEGDRSLRSRGGWRKIWNGRETVCPRSVRDLFIYFLLRAKYRERRA